MKHTPFERHTYPTAREMISSWRKRQIARFTILALALLAGALFSLWRSL